MEFEDLSNDEIVLIALRSNLDTINSLCSTVKRFRDLICDSNKFWYQKLCHDIGKPPVDDWRIIKMIDWKKNYAQTGKVYVYGDNSSGALSITHSTPCLDFMYNPSIRNKIIHTSSGSTFTVFIDIGYNVYVSGEINEKNYGFRKLEDVKCHFSASGKKHIALIDMDNNLWMLGDNKWGQLGLGDSLDRDQPTKVPDIKVRSVRCGRYHTIVIDLEYKLWSFGRGDGGQLGVGRDASSSSIPMLVSNKFRASGIACGSNHTVVVTTKRQIAVFGRNTRGQLGLVGGNKFRPVPLPNIRGKYVFAGENSTYVINNDKELVVFGDNTNGQLGISTNMPVIDQPTIVPDVHIRTVSCTKTYACFIDNRGNVLFCGYHPCDKSSRALGVPDRFKMIQNFKSMGISSSSNHSVIISGPPPESIPRDLEYKTYDEAMKMLKDGPLYIFDINPDYSYMLNNKENVIASFKEGNTVYVFETYRDPISGEIHLPI